MFNMGIQIWLKKTEMMWCTYLKAGSGTESKGHFIFHKATFSEQSQIDTKGKKMTIKKDKF